MMTTRIDAEAAIQALREAVAERGEDYVYPYARTNGSTECYYYHGHTEEEPAHAGCVVGLALNKLGVELDTLKLLDTAALGGGGISARHLHRLGAEILERDGVEVTRDAAHVFQDAQYVQDQAETWGRALATAEREFARISGSSS